MIEPADNIQIANIINKRSYVVEKQGEILGRADLGKKLIELIMHKAKEINWLYALYLETHTSLKAAVHLFKKLD